MTRILCIALLILPALVSAQIYKTIDKNGNVVYTDQPSKSGTDHETVELKQTNTAPPPPEVIRPEPEPDKKDQETTSYTVAITSPEHEATIPNGPGNFPLVVSLEPALAEGASLQLYLDGVARGEPQRALVWQLTNVFRGAHDLTVSVLNEDNSPIATSTPVRVYVFRPSRNN
ncbi:MAG: DUF4124 domain-containing protein [Halioglobus sp.]